jgi:parallel beta-helix repeat protein
MKKASTILIAALLGIACSIIALSLGRTASARAAASILYVAPGGACGGGVPNCYASLQAAVDAAAPGDEIHAAAGTYTDLSVRPRRDITTTGFVTQTLYLSKTVMVRGGYNSDFSAWNPDLYATTLDAQDMGRGIYVTGDISPTIEGLRITGGDATGQTGYGYYGAYDAGGGVYVISATITLNDNQVFSNTAPYGGGVFLGFSNGQIRGNKIFDNQAQSSGGGVFFYNGAPSLEASIVMSNTSNDLGGGLYFFSTAATLTGNIIRGNTANRQGGGLEVASCSPTLDDNIFTGNTANLGGGAFLWYNSSVLTNNVFVDNQAGETGSGLWLGGSEPLLLHTTFAGNSGGDGSGLTVDDANGVASTLRITNTLLASHSIGISVTAGSAATINGILWFSTPVTVSQPAAVSAQHQYVGDPAFEADGYHLAASSAAIGKGVSAGVTKDIDGQPRPLQSPDLGADEYWAPGYPKYVYLPVVSS